MWVLDSTRVFIQKYGGGVSQIIARLQPLDHLTVHQIFGRESQIIKFNGYVVGSGDLTTIITMDRDKTTHTLSGPYGILEECYVHTVQYDLTQIACQTLRPDLPDDSPVYVVDFELFKDE